MKSRKAPLPGFCKHKSPMKKTTNPPYVLDEIKLTAKYPNKKARRRGEERKLKQELYKNPVIKAVHGGTDKAARNIIKGFEHASIIAPVGWTARSVKGTKKVFDTFNKIAQNRKKQSKIIQESLEKKGYKFGPTKSSGWTGK